MRLFLFKILFKLTWWIAPDQEKVNRIFDMYLKEDKKEQAFKKCQERQAEKDKCIRPRSYPKVRGEAHYTDYFDDDNWKK